MSTVQEFHRMTQTTDSPTNKTGHLAWCALVALGMARKDSGFTLSAAQESLFLTRWLATAQKQRRFPRDVARDINWLIKQARELGVRAKLPEKLDYLWRSCTGDLLKQNDLFRLTYALEKAKEMGWVYRVLTAREWSGRKAVTLHDGINGIYILGYYAGTPSQIPADTLSNNIDGIMQAFKGSPDQRHSQATL